MFYNDIDKSQHPIGFYESLKTTYGSLNDEATFKKWAKDVFNNTMIFDDEKWNAFIAKPDASVLQADPAFAFASAFVKNYNTKYAPLYTAFVNKNNELGRAYMKGIMEMNPAAVKKMYPDSIAWSVTNSERDVINNYSVEYDAKKTSYKLGNEFVPFEYDEEIYKIKDGKDFKEKIKITKIGAVVYDENFGEQDDKKHLATYWRAEEPSNDLMAFYYLNKAKNHQDYLNALNYYACPGQNFIYADASNNIAIRQQGNFMLRTDYGDGILCAFPNHRTF